MSIELEKSALAEDYNLTVDKKLTIIIGTESFAPNISGVAVAAEKLACNLSQSGHNVYLFAPSRSFHTGKDESFTDYNVIRFKSFKNPFRKGFRIAFPFAKEISKAVMEIKPDIIHLHDPGSLCSSLKKSAKAQGIPIVITNHFNLDYVLSYFRYLEPLHPWFEKWLTNYLVKFYNECDCVTCPTVTIKKELENWGVVSPIVEISNGVDLERFYSYSSPVAVRHRYNLPSNVPIVLYVGRIDKDKSFEVFIRCIPNVLSKVDAFFLVVGDGDEIGKMKILAQNLGVAEKINFLGWIDHYSPDLPQIYQVASVFAIPSSIETQSIVTLEALASGLPVVGADGGALPELVKHGENGFLFSPRDSKALADYIIKILQDKNLADAMRRKSLEIVSEHRISESFARINKVYEEVLNKVSKREN